VIIIQTRKDLDMQTITYSVPGISCEHCRVAIDTEVSRLDGVATVDVDLAARQVAVSGPGLDDAAIRSAIDDAGYDVA
jgi:copper ion binding protein